MKSNAGNKYETAPISEVVHSLSSNENYGLTLDEAKKRLDKYGCNEIREKEETFIHRIFRRFWGPIPWMIETAAILSAIVKRWEDFSIIMIMLLANAFVDFYQESKALNAIKVLKQKLARQALVLRDGKWIQIASKELVIGDIIKVKIGDIVPADIKLIGGGEFLSIDQSALTGESLPVQREKGAIAYADSIIKQGEMTAIVTGTGSDTYFGKTVGLVAKAEREERSHFQKMVIRIGDFLIIITIVMIAIIIAFGIARHEPTIELLTFSLVLTISAIPVAMPAVLTVTMAIGAIDLAKKQAIVSRLAAIEELAGMDVLCADKTGTLTKNKMTISDPYTTNNFSTDDLILYAALASREENRDPIEEPIYNYLKEHKLYDKLSNYSMKKFTPFNPVSKRTEATLSNNNADVIITKGASQVVIELCNEKEFDKQKAYKMVDDFAQKGFRTLGAAYKKEHEEKYHFIGLIPLYDPPHKDSKTAIKEARENGVNVKMITGDNIAVAKYIAAILDIGDKIEDIRELKGESIEEYLILTKILSKTLIKTLNPDVSKDYVQETAEKIVSEVKKELYNIELPKGAVKKHESEIIALIENASGFAQVYPEDKYFIVEKLQKANHIVGMTGDGVNDAPALKKADTGIAVSNATDAARAAADIVLMLPGISVIVDAIKEARTIFERMKSYAIYRIAESIRIIVFMTLAIVVFNFYPITALMIIVLALLNDIPILSIAYDNTKVMPKPVRWNMGEVLVLSSWLGIAGVLSSFTLFWIFEEHTHLPIEFVQSAFFTKLVVAGHGTIYNTRIDNWFFKKPWPSKTLFAATFSSGIIGTIVAVYGFGIMNPIGWTWAAGMWGYALAWFLFNDVVKMAVLHYYRRRGKLNI